MKKPIISMFLMAGMTACGTASDNQPAPEAQQTEEAAPVDPEAQALDAELPEMVIMRVPLDENGQEMAGAEMRTLDQGASLVESEGAALASAFDTMAKATAAQDELDSDSSTQSWYLTQQQQYDQGQQQGQQQYQDPRQYQDQQQGQQQQYYGQQGQQRRVDPNCVPSATRDCGTTVVHQQGQVRNEYPVKRKVIYQHHTKNIIPQEKVDIYPVETVKVHPTQRTVRVHPVQRRVVYTNPCVRTNTCGPRLGYTNYWPTVAYRGYNQYYGYARTVRYGRYNYYSYCRPNFFRRHYGVGFYGRRAW